MASGAIPSFNDFVKGQSAPPAAAGAPPSFKDFSASYKDPNAPQPTWLDDVVDTVKQYWDKVNPVTQAQGAAGLVTTDPRKTLASYGATNAALAQKAEDSFKAGNYAEGVRHSLSYVAQILPGFGAALDEAGNKSGAGDYKGAVADTAAIATNLLAAKFGPEILDAATEPGAIPKAMSAVAAPVKAAAKAAADVYNMPGTPDMLKGAGKVAVGAKVMAMGGPEGIVGGGMTVASGAKNIAKGWQARQTAAAQAQAAFEEAKAQAAKDAAMTGPSPLGANATSGTVGATPMAASPEVTAPTAAPAPAPPTNASYYATGATAGSPSPPPPSQPSPYTSSSTLDPAATAAPSNAAQYSGPAPSGTIQGVIVPSAESVPAAPASPAYPPIYDGIAQGFGAKSYAAMDAAGQQTVQRVAQGMSPAAAAPAPTPAATPYDATAENLAATYKKNAANADEVKAQWLFEHRKTGADLTPGQSFKDLVDQIPNPNAKSGKFTTRLHDPDHPARVKAVADLLDAKIAAKASADAAAALNGKGVKFADAANMTPEQLGAKDAKGAADVIFQLQKLQSPAVQQQ